jgi:hypothetical protein
MKTDMSKQSPDVDESRLHLHGPPSMGRWILPFMLLAWAMSFWPFDDWISSNGSPFLADYAQFYVAGDKVIAGDFGSLYDNADNQRRMLEVLPELDPEFSLPFRYPPHVAVALAPLAMLSYPLAATLFFLLSVAIYAAVLVLLRRELEFLKRLPALSYYSMAAGFPLALETLIGGQLSLFALASVVGAACLLRRNRPVAAGVVLGLLCYKPNVALLLVLGCCLRYPKTILGGVLTGGCVLAFTLLVAGGATLAAYVDVAIELAGGRWDIATPAWKVHGLAPWLEQLNPGVGNALALSIGLLFVVAWTTLWRCRDLGVEVGFAGLIVLNALFGVYTPIYDLLLLGVAGLLLAEARLRDHHLQWISNRNVQVGLYLLWFGPHLSQLVATEVGMQFFSGALLTFLVGIHCSTRSSNDTSMILSNA